MSLICQPTSEDIKHHFIIINTEILQTLVGMGGAALTAAVALPGKATKISRKELMKGSKLTTTTNNNNKEKKVKH